MIYCDLISSNDNMVEYAIGGSARDITGRIVIDYKNQEYDIVKQPERSKIYTVLIDRMLRKHQTEFEKGIFKKKMSYEIG